MNIEYFNTYKEIIPSFERFINHLKGTLPQYIRINSLKVSIEELLSQWKNKGVQFSSTCLDYMIKLEDDIPVGNLKEYQLGYIYPQTLTSAIAGHVLGVRPDETVLDMCAAPGSKTGQIAQLMQDRGLIVANDPLQKRQGLLIQNLKRLGITNTIFTGYLGQNFPMHMKFDKILVDVPCSGEGNYRVDENGNLINREAVRMKRLFNVQKQLLLRAFDILEPGGIIVYSTCTYNPVENEAVVNHLLKTSEDAFLLPIDLPIQHTPGCTEWNNEQYEEELKLCWRIYPHQVSAVGFFVAKISKRR